MKKFARKVRKAVKAEMPKYYAHLDMEMDRRIQAEKIAALVKNENHDMAKTINQLADEKLKALKRIDELVINAAEIARQRDELAEKNATYDEEIEKYQDTIEELQKMKLEEKEIKNMYFNSLNLKIKECEELEKKLEESRKPWWRKKWLKC